MKSSRYNIKQKGGVVNMKKCFIYTVIILILIFSFVGCQNNTHLEESEDTKIDLEKVYNSIIDAQPKDAEELILFQETSEDYLEELYTGLKDIELEEKVIYVHPIGIACEIALVQVKNSNDVKSVEEIFSNRIEKGIESIMCDSEAQDIWRRRAEVQTKGKYVCMIVLPDGYEIPENVFDVE